MKKKNQKKTQTDTCSSPVAPWVLARTKQEAFRKGVFNGVEEGKRLALNEMKDRLDKVNIDRSNAITDIIKSSASVSEAMARLVMAAEKQF